MAGDQRGGRGENEKREARSECARIRPSSNACHAGQENGPFYICLLFPFILTFTAFSSRDFKASGEELDSIQATCNDLLQTHEQLRAIIPNEQVKRRLDGEATFIAQEWDEVYNREKSRLIKGHFEDLRASLERDIDELHKEWAEVNRLFSTLGYSADIHERYQVEFSHFLFLFFSTFLTLAFVSVVFVFDFLC